MHPNHDYLWSIDPNIPIAIVINGEVTHVNGTGFEKRIHTHVETGSITISNLTISDSGILLAQVLTKTGILEQRFNLSVHDNSLIPLNVLKGGNITLDTGLKKLQKEHKVMWTQGPDFSGKLIAQLNNFSTFIEESFKDILQLNLQTGSITLLRLTENYADYYCVKIMLGIEPHILRKYLITVFGPVSVPHISRTQINITHSVNDVNCSLRCSVESAPGVTLSWYRGEKKINQTSSSDISTNLTLRLVIQDQDEGNYSCVAANPVSKEAVTLNSTLWCPPHGTGTRTIYSFTI
ncbi:hypothetical protein GBF38_022243 [Nibea albiflora]|uniref:Uncharacterized protein n=1 Tax=Nibea albiflora TaxID=240163 RepID=A0ACB7FKN4_NIBAL|nr:hypothetical protein GBF38_022243 [Nibea albiflora]